jgi:hypothetical protein
MQIAPTAHSSTHVRLVVESFDSGEECSFQHWLEVCQLVDEGDEERTDTEVIAEMEPAAWN